MHRFESFSHLRDATRRVLRDRIGRSLRPAYEPETPARNRVFPVTDMEVLELLSRVEVTYDDEVEKVRAAFTVYADAHPGTPTFDELIEDGWFGVTWGRVVTQLHTRDAARQQDEPLRTGIEMVLNTRHMPRFYFSKLTDLSRAAQQMGAELVERPENFRLPARSPGWIAGRLWERRPRVADAEALRWWVDRWHLLGEPLGAPTAWWSEDDACAWRRAAMATLRDERGLAAWSREKGLVDAWLRHQRGRAPSPAIASTLVEKYLWLNDTHCDHWGRALELCGDTWVLIDMLCQDLVASDGGLEGPSTGELLDVVVERPALLVLLATRIQQHPTLLADLLLHSPTSALACLMIADWNTQPIGAWERSLQMTEQTQARERTFADAIALAAAHLREGSGSVDELSKLLIWVHAQVRRDERETWDHKISARLLEELRSTIQALPTQLLEALLSALSFVEGHGLGTPRFTAALDVATSAALTEGVDADGLVKAYVATFRLQGLPYSIALTPEQAASLVLVAQRSAAWSTFLEPIDVRERVQTFADVESKYVARDQTARALRMHIRVLSRAIVAWKGVPPDEIIDALASAIRSGACDHEEKGRVGAFAAQYEAGPAAFRSEPPLMDDIADACSRFIRGTSRSGLQAAVSQIDEPLALARLHQKAPSWMQASLTAHLESLPYDQAAEIASLTEMAGRIDELLAAGLATVAAEYMKVELGLATFGRVEGREVARLRWKLRLALLQGDFLCIAETTVPEGLDSSEVASAHDVVTFYKGVAELSKPHGSPSHAEQLFVELAKRHPVNAAYVVNLFAARVSRLLTGDMFAMLTRSDIPTAVDALSAADSGIESAVGVRENDRKILESNRALLLLAVGQHHQAYDVLRHGPGQRQDDTQPAYTAVALARMGRGEEAMATLAAGEAAHPDSPVLSAARQHLERGMPGRFHVLSISKDDTVATIQSALFRLTRIDPSAQALVVSRETTEAHITEEVRLAAAGVTATVPMMQGPRLHEDEVTRYLMQILQAGVRIFGWAVSDQSKGGYSANGNPGERDLVLRKDGYAIAVIEAMICDSNPATETTRKELTSHLQKLFGYDECSVFYHVVYAYLEEPSAVVDVMREIAKSSAPPAFTFAHMNDLPGEDSRPQGFVSMYLAQGGTEVKVVCLVLDMRQQAQRDAAALAGKTRASTRRKK